MTCPECGRPPEPTLASLESRIRRLEARLPDTRLLHPRILPRAFAVWGHAAIAGALVALPFVLLLVLLYVLVSVAGGVGGR